MKKFLSIVMAVFCVAFTLVPAFAAEKTDFEYKPQPGAEAPSNYYDPAVYDQNLELIPNAFDFGGSYCTKHHKAYVIRTGLVSVKNPESADGFETIEFCPYCGEICSCFDYSHADFYLTTHKLIDNVVYGYYCPQCEAFMGFKGYGTEENLPYEGLMCNCQKCGFVATHENVKIYRFLTPDNIDKEFSYLFDETAYKYGDGVDEKEEELTYSAAGYYWKWNKGSSEQEPELNFFQKIIQWFKNIFASIANLFK